MTRAWNRPPTPEQLAAYFDGELTGHAREAIASWLVENPDAAATSFAEHDDELARAWQQTQPADPTPSAWAGVVGRIAAGVPAAGAPPRRTPLGWKMIGAAAAALGFVLIGRALWPTPNLTSILDRDKLAALFATIRPKMEPEEENDPTQPPFAVVASADLRVLSMDGNDTQVEVEGRLVKSLVVGEPPVNDEVLLPTSYERTRLLGWIDPALRFEEWSVPIIVDPDVPTKTPQP